MKLLELACKLNADFKEQLPASNKYVEHGTTTVVTEAVEDIVATGPSYVPIVKPGKASKKKAKRIPTTDRTETSLINTLWFYSNADAS